MVIPSWMAGSALIGIVAAAWQYLRMLWQYATSLLIVRAEFSSQSGDMMLNHCWYRLEASPWGIRSFTSIRTYVRSKHRDQTILMEYCSGTGRIFWDGWKPIWIKSNANTTPKPGDPNGLVVDIAFIRGTYELDKLLRNISEHYDDEIANSTKRDSTNFRRYAVYTRFGSAGEQPQRGESFSASSPTATPGGTLNNDSCWERSRRILFHDWEDLGPELAKKGHALDNVAMMRQASEMVVEARRWLKSEDWYRERGIPWRLGWNFYGLQGTGKTSLARAVAEDLDLPVFAFALSTFTNRELQRNWEDLYANLPCVALIEDIDAVFSKRHNKLDTGLTFDVLLNCIDGIARKDGVFLIVTTNKIDELDEALGVPDKAGRSSRPGRLDRVLEFTALDEHGRQLIAKRILRDWPQLQAETVLEGAGDTGAQFQDRCRKLALELYWSVKDDETNHTADHHGFDRFVRNGAR